MNFLKLTELRLTAQGYVNEHITYINPHHILDFERIQSSNFKMELTKIHYALGGFNPTCVKETPEEIINLLNT